MIIFTLYLIIAAYLLGKLEDAPHSPATILICLFWLPAGLCYLSARLALHTLDDHAER
ncbi:hypothetical protein [Pantoea sp. GM01]|uniref:hypothetical protein n=1 Tax=Pantoea sp. GM01 TaxID=1144320 RepID=UPI0002714BCB|nr:hypothetical protein [Pantoea sp. GM01]EJL80979.1 hypothetical protein PMI17_05082 [Pantoea sp. GM01]